MTRHDLQILDTLGTPDYIPGELSDEGQRALAQLLDVGFRKLN